MTDLRTTYDPHNVRPSWWQVGIGDRVSVCDRTNTSDVIVGEVTALERLRRPGLATDEGSIKGVSIRHEGRSWNIPIDRIWLIDWHSAPPALSVPARVPKAPTPPWNLDARACTLYRQSWAAGYVAGYQQACRDIAALDAPEPTRTDIFEAERS